MNIPKDTEKQVYAMLRGQLENTADQIQRKIIAEANKALEDYYKVPEGDYYIRTEKFKNLSYDKVKRQHMRNINDMSIEVGVKFNRNYEYEDAGISSEDIYTDNLSGGHGGRSVTSEDILAHMNAFLDELAK